MKKTLLILTILTLSSCRSININDSKATINTTLDAWHNAAATANFETYFSLMTDDAIFIGTDATENWNKKDFQAYAKPHFDKGKAWSFTVLERQIFIDKSGKIAWFNELLNTQMKICRGSGVLIKKAGNWKIANYVLSMTIPNAISRDVIKIKQTTEDSIVEELQKKRQ